MGYKDPEKIREYRRAYREANLEKVRRYSREWARAKYAANPEKAREDVRNWRLANPEKVSEIQARQNQKRKGDERTKSADRARYRENSARWVAYARAWRDAHPEYKKGWDAARQPDVIKIGGKRIYIPALPPELQEVARLLKQTRKAIRETQSGRTAT